MVTTEKSSMPAAVPAAKLPAPWHVPEYLCEFLGTAFMLFIGIGAVSVFWGDGSPVAALFPKDGGELWKRIRLLCTGIVFAGGATMVVYSRLGKRSGAHINPAVTFGFWKLGKINTRDALAYVVAQFLGAFAGVFAVLLAFGPWARSVKLGITTPDADHWIIAFVAEVVITFMLMALILTCINTPRVAPITGILAGSLVAFLVMSEAPVSGTSLNPARSLAPAVLASSMQYQWIYLIAPPIGALLGVAYGRSRFAHKSSVCAKLYHTEEYPCPFLCGYELVKAGEVIMRENDPADCAWVIDRGEVEVRKHDARGADTVIARIGPRDMIGEMALLLNQPRSATVVAASDCQLRRLTRNNFFQVLAEDPEASMRLIRQLAQRLSETDRRMMSQTTGST